VTLVLAVNAPPVAAHATETPGTTLPDLSVAFARKQCYPGDDRTESALALTIAVAGPAVADDQVCRRHAGDPPVNVAARGIAQSRRSLPRRSNC
jgi:hypothetical protein